jgi:hypothetical protein
MKYLLTILLAVSCCCQSFALTADQLAQFQSITWWESEIALPPGSFNIEVLEFSDGKMSKAVTEVFAGPAGADQVPSTTGNTPILIMWKPSDHGLLMTVTMGGDTRPGTPGACQNFNGPQSLNNHPYNASGAMKSIKEGDYILGGEPLIQDGVAHVTNDIKDYKRVLVLRVSKKA